VTNAKRVLVVDDEASARAVLCRWLAGWGYEVWEAVSADAAIEVMEQTPADIVITDIRMPVHDGVWLLQELRRRWPETAVIMESGVEDAEIVQNARRLGAQAFLPKPYGKEMLRQALEGLN
jgi:ATP-dependent Lon protease